MLTIARHCTIFVCIAAFGCGGMISGSDNSTDAGAGSDAAITLGEPCLENDPFNGNGPFGSCPGGFHCIIADKLKLRDVCCPLGQDNLSDKCVSP
ncbi:MAG TPA: hypothetical protein VH054_23975, partial [Polyangiaceae bacterium]|nr:hypothetical protein [Polyangiaceae bacterium]